MAGMFKSVCTNREYWDLAKCIRMQRRQTDVECDVKSTSIQWVNPKCKPKNVINETHSKVFIPTLLHTNLITDATFFQTLRLHISSP